MIKLIHGDDEFSSKELLNEFTGKATDVESDVNFIYPNKLTESTFSELVNTMSLFGDSRKLVFFDLISKITSSKNEQWKDFNEICINKPTMNEVIFFESKEINIKSTKIKKFLDVAEIYLLNLPSGRGSWDKIRKWIVSRQANHQLDLSSDAVNKLIELIGNNFRYLDNELFKLSNYKPNAKIEESDIELMVSGIKETSIFELIDSILEKNLFKSDQLINEFINKGQNFFSIEQMLARQLRLIIMTQDLLGENNNQSIQNKIQVKSNFAFNKILNQAQNFSHERMKIMLQNLLILDLGIKNGTKTEKEVMGQLVHLL
ncbi:MAG: DNA polymerase III subunit delta [Chloroflexi bacterium]|nr:DNA polymerase III subunit delta [Chloroflexota bacterium]